MVSWIRVGGKSRVVIVGEGREEGGVMWRAALAVHGVGALSGQ